MDFKWGDPSQDPRFKPGAEPYGPPVVRLGGKDAWTFEGGISKVAHDEGLSDEERQDLLDQLYEDAAKRLVQVRGAAGKVLRSDAQSRWGFRMWAEDFNEWAKRVGYAWRMTVDDKGPKNAPPNVERKPKLSAREERALGWHKQILNLRKENRRNPYAFLAELELNLATAAKRRPDPPSLDRKYIAKEVRWVASRFEPPSSADLIQIWNPTRRAGVRSRR